MPEILRSFLVVLFVAGAVFGAAHVYAKELGIDAAALRIRRNTWFALTAAAFLANSAWFFLAIAAVVLLYAVKWEKNILALVFAILYAVPLIGFEIPGFGIVNYLFQIDYFRLISILIFIPLYFRLKNRKDASPIGAHAADVFVLVYICYLLVSAFPRTTFTHFLRVGFGYFIDIFLPYYVASRYFKSVQDMNEALKMLLLSSVLVGMLGFFEFAKGWLLYSRIADSWGVDWGLGWYLQRGGLVRALASSGQPIVLGYMLAVAVGVYLYLSTKIKSNSIRFTLAAIVFAGNFAPISRGPWVGAVLICFVWFATGANALKNLTRAALIFGVVFVSILITPYGDKLSEFLPFVGKSDEHNIEFRKNLLENSLSVIEKNPFFGSADYMGNDELLSLKSGGEGGIVDIVNSYIAIALSGGLVGLALFVGIFLAAGLSVYSGFKISPLDGDQKALGRALFSVLIGILFIIYTVSSISFVPIIYWLVCGLCVSYNSLVFRRNI